MYRILVHSVEILLLCRHRDLDLVRVLRNLDDTEISGDFVVTLRSPGDVMHVGELDNNVNEKSRNLAGQAHSIDVEHSDI